MIAAENPRKYIKPAHPRRHHLFVSSLLLLAACYNRPGPISPESHFSDLSPMTGKRFVAYISPDPKAKPDTIEFSWSHPGIDFGSIAVVAFLDSGTTRIALSGFASTETSRTTLRWVPGDDTLHFNFFGIKECVLDLTDEPTGRSARSDPFFIIGSRPFVIESPTGGEHYSMNDSIAVKYQINSDRISNIRVFFRNDSMTTWMEIAGSTKRTSDENPPLRSFTTIFVPHTWDTLFANQPGIPFRFLLKDYNSPLPNSSSISGDIFVE